MKTGFDSRHPDQRFYGLSGGEPWREAVKTGFPVCRQAGIPGAPTESRNRDEEWAVSESFRPRNSGESNRAKLMLLCLRYGP